MKTTIGRWALVFALAGWLVPGVQALPLGAGGKAVLGIRTAPGATLAEQTAAQELSTYLGTVIGAVPAVAEEAAGPGGPAIYVGATRFAVAHGVDCAALGSEEWVIKTVDGSLVLAGGRPRGVLYAVYRFLEDQVGVHWWNPWEESVPATPNLSVGDLDLRGKPVLAYRDIYMLYGRDGGRFAARSRLNRDGDVRIGRATVAAATTARPTCTRSTTTCPKQYVGEHPEYFSLISSKRMAEQHQLCLSNPALRDLFVELRAYIQSRKRRPRRPVRRPRLSTTSRRTTGVASASATPVRPSSSARVQRRGCCSISSTTSPPGLLPSSPILHRHARLHVHPGAAEDDQGPRQCHHPPVRYPQQLHLPHHGREQP